MSLCFPVIGWTETTATTAQPVLKYPHASILLRGRPEDEFFRLVGGVIEAAAKDLGVNAELIYTDRNPIVMLEKGAEILQRPEKPDYLVMINDQDVVPRLMQQADELGVTTVLFNGALSEQRYAEFREGKGP
ncbi:MAG: hypothetical protein R3E95_02965 [Thiolinea sp.]